MNDQSIETLTNIIENNPSEVYTYIHQPTGLEHMIRAKFGGYTLPTGPYNYRYAIFWEGETPRLIPDHHLTIETKTKLLNYFALAIFGWIFENIPYGTEAETLELAQGMVNQANFDPFKPIKQCVLSGFCFEVPAPATLSIYK